MKMLLFTFIMTFSFLVFFVNMMLITWFFLLIKQKKYRDHSPLWLIPDYYPNIGNWYIKWFLNYLTWHVIVFVGIFVFSSKPTFDETFWYKVLFTCIMVPLVLVTILIIKKMKFLNGKSFYFYSIELGIIVFFMLSSLYLFNIIFEWFEKVYWIAF